MLILQRPLFLPEKMQYYASRIQSKLQLVLVLSESKGVHRYNVTSEVAETFDREMLGLQSRRSVFRDAKRTLVGGARTHR